MVRFYLCRDFFVSTMGSRHSENRDFPPRPQLCKKQHSTCHYTLPLSFCLFNLIQLIQLIFFGLVLLSRLAPFLYTMPYCISLMWQDLRLIILVGMSSWDFFLMTFSISCQTWIIFSLSHSPRLRMVATVGEAWFYWPCT